MARYRSSLPQLGGTLYLTDGGLETTMIFHRGLDLPFFCAIDLMRSERGVKELQHYYRAYAEAAREAGAGFIFESPTWRSSRDWASKLGCSEAEFAELNGLAVGLMVGLRDELESASQPMVISGCIGPRGDGYSPGDMMTVEEAADYHQWQTDIFAETEADMITAITMNYVNEAAGVALAAKASGMPCAISFTVETDGRLVTGESLSDAINTVDEITGRSPAYYMVNCAHPTHFGQSLADGMAGTERIRGLRANASAKSHAELDESTELDEGNPPEFGREHAQLVRRFPHINVLGGCCGTDIRHVRELGVRAADR